MIVSAVGALDPAAYRPHALHRSERAFPEANCYVDLWIELLHALGLDPLACLAFTLSADFEGDQWTFFKPPLGDLARLYGVDVQELNVYRSLELHVYEQVNLGRVVIAEVDAFYLPDTAGTTYRQSHGKTAIGVQAIDVDGKALEYFHNGGYHALGPDDFDGSLRLGLSDPATLPPYVEFVKLDRLVHRAEGDLTNVAVDLARLHLGRRPESDPVDRFVRRFEADTAELIAGDLATYHRYAFATLRQIGASFEMAAAFARFLEAKGVGVLAHAAADLDASAATAKTWLFKAARAVNAKRPLDASELAGAMGQGREVAFAAIAAAVGA